MSIKKYYGVERTNEYGVTKRPHLKLSIQYHKGGKGYLSYYYLSCIKGMDEHREGERYTMESYIIDLFPSSIMLSTVARKSAKEQTRLEAWLEANADGIMQNWMLGTVGNSAGNMKAVFHYVMAHRPGNDAVGQYQNDEKFHSIPLSDAFDGYTAKTQAMWDLSTMVDDAEKTKAYVTEHLEHYAERSMYEHMTELYLVCAWMHEYGKSTEETSGLYYELSTMVQEKMYSVYAQDSDEIAYFVDKID